MTMICPTIDVFDSAAYRQSMRRVSFAHRVHIDVMDGVFTPAASPPLDQTWWPHHTVADIHLMHQRPMESLEQLIRLKPHLVIIHNEADVHHMHFAAALHQHGIKAGLALLQDTPVAWAEQIMHSFDHVLVFSGRLGYYGGQADMGLLDKVQAIRAHHSEVEIGWDGGVNDHTARQLAAAGVDVLNVGGFIQNATDPEAAYATLESLIRDSDEDKTHH